MIVNYFKIITNNILFKILLVITILIIAGYFSYNYYLDQKPVITIYAEEAIIKIKPQEMENIMLHGMLYENLVSKRTIIRNAILLPEPEKPLNINSRKPNDEMENLLMELSNAVPIDQIANLIAQNDNVNLALTKSPIVKKNKIGLNIIKVNKESEKIIDNKEHSYFDGYKIQLACVKSEIEAISEGEKIKKKFAKILKNVEITTKRIKHNDEFFYLVMAGNYNSISSAKAVCQKLLHRKQSCILK